LFGYALKHSVHKITRYLHFNSLHNIPTAFSYGCTIAISITISHPKINYQRHALRHVSFNDSSFKSSIINDLLSALQISGALESLGMAHPGQWI